MKVSEITEATLPIEFGKVFFLNAGNFSVEQIINNPLKQSLIIINNQGLVNQLKAKNQELSVKYNISGVELALPFNKILTSIVGLFNKINRTNIQSKMKYVAAIFITKKEFNQYLEHTFEFETYNLNDISLLIILE